MRIRIVRRTLEEFVNRMPVRENLMSWMSGRLFLGNGITGVRFLVYLHWDCLVVNLNL